MVHWWWLLVVAFVAVLVCFLVIGALHGKARRREIWEIEDAIRRTLAGEGGYLKFDGRRGSWEFRPMIKESRVRKEVSDVARETGIA